MILLQIPMHQLPAALLLLLLQLSQKKKQRYHVHADLPVMHCMQLRGMLAPMDFHKQAVICGDGQCQQCILNIPHVVK